MLYNEKWNRSKTGEIFLQAADYMRERGWCQKIAIDGDGSVCLIGAISQAAWSWGEHRHMKYQVAVERLE